MTPEEVRHVEASDAEHCSCVPHLRAEIERLRAQRVLSNEDFARAFDLGLAAGEKRERAAVVAYLRSQRAEFMSEQRGISAYVIQCVAEAIERGEHRREEKP